MFHDLAGTQASSLRPGRLPCGSLGPARRAGHPGPHFGFSPAGGADARLLSSEKADPEPEKTVRPGSGGQGIAQGDSGGAVVVTDCFVQNPAGLPDGVIKAAGGFQRIAQARGGFPAVEPQGGVGFAGLDADEFREEG